MEMTTYDLYPLPNMLYFHKFYMKTSERNYQGKDIYPLTPVMFGNGNQYHYYIHHHHNYMLHNVRIGHGLS